MGHLINPFALRLGLTRTWPVVTTSVATVGLERSVKDYVEQVFDSRSLRDFGFIYDSVLIHFSSRSLRLEIFVYDGAFDRASRGSFFGEKVLHSSVGGLRPFGVIGQNQYSFSDFRSELSGKKIGNSGSFFYFCFLLRNRFYTSFQRMLERDIAVVFLKDCKVSVKVQIRFLSAGYLPASALSRYITRKLEYQYKLQEVVLPLMKGLERSVVGFSAKCSGRFTRAQRASKSVYRVGLSPFSTLGMHFDYGFRATRLKYGLCGVKVIICRKK